MLEKFEDSYSDSFTSHVWILMENEILIAESERHSVFHSEAFGGEAWDIDERGYFSESKSVVTCHSRISKALLNKIEKAFDKAGLIAIYFKGEINDTVQETTRLHATV